MLVQIANGKLLFRATNDLKYVLGQIPGTVDHYKQKELPSTKVRVELTLNGRYEQDQPKPSSSKGVSKKGKKVDLGTTHRTVITTEHRLGECTGGQVVNEISAQIQKLTEKGFILSSRVEVGEVVEEDEAA